MYLLINIEAYSVYPTEFHTHPQIIILQIDGVSYREELLHESWVSSIFVHFFNVIFQELSYFCQILGNVIRMACLLKLLNLTNCSETLLIFEVLRLIVVPVSTVLESTIQLLTAC